MSKLSAENKRNPLIHPERKYPCLPTIFLKGSFSGQIKSVYRTRDSHPHKLEEFKRAIAAAIFQPTNL
jgi:hypothetical protein